MISIRHVEIILMAIREIRNKIFNVLSIITLHRLQWRAKCVHSHFPLVTVAFAPPAAPVPALQRVLFTKYLRKRA